MRRTFRCRNNEDRSLSHRFVFRWAPYIDLSFQIRRRPERSRFSGGAESQPCAARERDLACSESVGVGNLKVLGMKSTKLFLIALALLMACPVAVRAQASRPELRIDDVTVLDVKGGPPQADRCVIVKNDRIVDVAS